MASCKRCGKPAQFMSDLCPECLAKPDALEWLEASRAADMEVDDGNTSQGSQGPAKDDSGSSGNRPPRSLVIRRYRDAYRVAAALIALGHTIKIIGWILAVIVVVGSLGSSGGPFGGAGVVIAGLFFTAIVGVIAWVLGVIVAAQGQILQATLDAAVAKSPFLTDPERAEAMGLPLNLVAG